MNYKRILIILILFFFIGFGIGFSFGFKKGIEYSIKVGLNFINIDLDEEKLISALEIYKFYCDQKDLNTCLDDYKIYNASLYINTRNQT